MRLAAPLLCFAFVLLLAGTSHAENATWSEGQAVPTGYHPAAKESSLVLAGSLIIGGAYLAGLVGAGLGSAFGAVGTAHAPPERRRRLATHLWRFQSWGHSSR
jgi:hypothetical protein